MKRACVIGWPIAHSRSPLIHGFWLRQYGVDGTYSKEAVRTEDIASFLPKMHVLIHHFFECFHVFDPVILDRIGKSAEDIEFVL